MLLLFYCCVIFGVSLAGGWLVSRANLSHRQLELVVSFVAGVIFGISLLHLLPHAVGQLGDPELAMYCVLAGFLTMFFLERVVCFHHHHAEKNDHADAHHYCSHHALTWTGAVLGLSLHSILAGVALASGVVSAGDVASGWPGVGVFFAIVLHKPFDSMSVLGLMRARNLEPKLCSAVNALFALAVPLGALLFMFGVSQALLSPDFVALMLAFAAGMFLCISLSDLLPELQFHQHDRVALSVALLLGIGVAVAIGFLEPESLHHQHSHH